MRIATFNVENLFSRAAAMNGDSWTAGKKVLTEFSQLNIALQRPQYSAADRRQILRGLKALGLERTDDSRFAVLRQNRGRLIQRPRSGSPEIVASGRADWVGWLELKTEAVNEVALQMTARVIKDLEADILAVIEAENRVALQHFNSQLLRPLGADYGAIMLIDGNDDRGIDVGLLARTGYAIESIVSHVDDLAGGRPIFSRDCPEYTVRLRGDRTLLVLVNHFKSKGYGSPAASDARRKSQAQRVREIYDLRRKQGVEWIAVVGDFNDTPNSDPLAPLLANGSDLKDISRHDKYADDGRPGTFGNGTASNKIDYLLLSPDLFARVTAGGIHRKGVWGGKNGTLFPHYPEMLSAAHAASDHAALWAEIDLS